MQGLFPKLNATIDAAQLRGLSVLVCVRGAGTLSCLSICQPQSSKTTAEALNPRLQHIARC